MSKQSSERKASKSAQVVGRSLDRVVRRVIVASGPRCGIRAAVAIVINCGTDLAVSVKTRNLPKQGEKIRFAFRKNAIPIRVSNLGLDRHAEPKGMKE